ncbi:MAG: ECF transporter S component [Candidatus Bathyarchaeia archaeon]
MDCRRVAMLAILTALCVALQITPRLPNVEATSLISFLVGFLFGASFGAILGALTMFINGFLSPWGLAGIIMPFQMAGMALIGLAGGVYRKVLGGNPKEAVNTTKILKLEVSFLAAFLTLIYDILTNIGWALPSETPIIAALIQGVWYSVIHVVSNAVFFGGAFFILVRIIGNLLGENLWRSQKEV